jgi:hypothetical protein
MGAARSVLDLLFDAATWPFGSLPPFWGLLFVSLLSGVWIILLFKAFSPQRRIKRIRSRMGAQALGMLLFLASPLQVLRLAGGLLWSNFRYLALILLPLAVIALPFGITYGQLEARYAHAYPTPGDTLTATLAYAGGLPSDDEAVSSLQGLSALPPVVGIDSLGQVSFRLRAGETLPRRIAAEDGHVPVGRRSARSGAIVYTGAETPSPGSFFRPGNHLLPGPEDEGLRSAAVSIPGRDYAVLGGRWSWLAVFLVFSSLSAVAGAVVFKVKV